MQTPLLRPLNDDDDKILHHCWNVQDEQESTFSRLIALGAELAESPLLYTDDNGHTALQPNGTCQSEEQLHRLSIKGLLICGILWCCYTPLVWSIYSAESMFEIMQPCISNSTHTVGSIQSGNNTTDTCITKHSVSMANFTQILASIHEHKLKSVVWVCGLVLPCIVIITTPFTIKRNFQTPFNISTRIQSISIDSQLPRLMLTPVCILLLFFNMASWNTQSKDDDNDSSFNLHYKLQAPLVCYTGGVFLSILSVYCLRSNAISSNDAQFEQLIESGERECTKTPLQADDIADHMLTLEETQHLVVRTSSANDKQKYANVVKNDTTKLQRSAPWKSLVIADVAVLAVFLTIPAVYAPIYHVKYRGLTQSSRGEEQTSVDMWGLLLMIRQQAVLAGTNSIQLYILLAIGAILIIICPLAVMVLCVVLRTCDSQQWTDRIKQHIYNLQPMLGGIIFASAMLLVAPAASPWMQYTLRESDNVHYCNSDSDIDCISVRVAPAAGCYTYFFHSLLLEVLVQLSIMWD